VSKIVPFTAKNPQKVADETQSIAPSKKEQKKEEEAPSSQKIEETHK